MTDIAHLRALLTAATLPWRVDASDPEDVVVWTDSGRWIANVGAWDNDDTHGPAAPRESAASAVLITEAVNALPNLLDELERLRAVGSLDAAWAEAEFALPRGWHIELIGASGFYVASAGQDHKPMSINRAERTCVAALRALAKQLP